MPGQLYRPGVYAAKVPPPGATVARAGYGGLWARTQDGCGALRVRRRKAPGRKPG